MSLSPTQITLTNDIRADAVAVFDPAGNQLSGFDSSRPATAVISTLAATNVTQVLLAANPARRRVVIVNEAGKALFVAFAATVTTSAYTFQVAGGQTYLGQLNDYTGVISAMLTSGTGNVRVTEIST